MFQISALHQSNYDNYVSDFGDPMLVLNLHCCLMCQESVTCDAEDISEHLNIAHALSLEDYHDRYIANDRTVSTAKKQNSLCRNWDKHHGKLILLIRWYSNVVTDDLAVKPYIPHKSLIQ